MSKASPPSDRDSVEIHRTYCRGKWGRYEKGFLWKRACDMYIPDAVAKATGMTAGRVAVLKRKIWKALKDDDLYREVPKTHPRAMKV